MRGRPSSFTPELAAELCARMVCGDDGRVRSLRSVCLDDDMPDCSTVFRWLGHPDREDFRQQYARACEARADVDAETIREIASTPEPGVIETLELLPDRTQPKDPATGEYPLTLQVTERRVEDAFAHRRLQIDALKWLMEKRRPKVYGNRTQHDHDVTGTLEALVVASLPPALALPAPETPALAGHQEQHDE